MNKHEQDAMFEQHYPRAHRLARRLYYTLPSIPKQDFDQAAALGLWKAIQAKGEDAQAFGPYSTALVKSELNATINNHLGISAGQARALRRQASRQPTQPPSADRRHKAAGNASSILQLRQPKSIEADSQAAEQLPPAKPSPTEATAAARDLTNTIKTALRPHQRAPGQTQRNPKGAGRSVSPQITTIVLLHAIKQQTPATIAVILKTTTNWVRYQLATALNILRHHPALLHHIQK